MLLREKFWLWGHPEGRYNNEFGNTKVSRMTPMEACLYLGVRNTFMVPTETHVNRRQYNKSFKTLKEVGWECFNAATNLEFVNPIIEEARDFSNIGRVVLDDFFIQNKKAGANAENLWRLRDKLHNNPIRHLDMWMVLYTHEIGIDEENDDKIRRFIEPFDGIILWTWGEKDLDVLPQKYEIFKKLTPNIRRMLGCYLYNFGEDKQATGEAVKWQLDWYREKILAKEAEGVVLHTNTMADLDYDAYDVAIEWMEKHGDEIVSD